MKIIKLTIFLRKFVDQYTLFTNSAYNLPKFFTYKMCLSRIGHDLQFTIFFIKLVIHEYLDEYVSMSHQKCSKLREFETCLCI